MAKEKRTQFIIVRVTTKEKSKLRKTALNTTKKFSEFIRYKLGLRKDDKKEYDNYSSDILPTEIQNQEGPAIPSGTELVSERPSQSI